MGSGSFSSESFAHYSHNVGRVYHADTGRVSGQTFTTYNLDDSLDPRKFAVRECANTEEHPNTIPVILALDVTGSMGEACRETAEALGVIINNLYKKFKDIEFCVMGVGDFAYDDAPMQMSQFESDVRIAEALDKIWLEHGGGGNGYESYTAAWYMGLHRTKLDCYDKQGRKGIIITMGDEPLNPYIPKRELNNKVNASEEKDIETPELFANASKKFDIFHIAVDSPKDCYNRYAKDIEKGFGQILGSRLKISTIQQLADTIEDCITESVQGTASTTPSSGGGEISW